MFYVICAFGGIFIVLAIAMLFVSYRERHFGMFLMGITYGTSGLLAIALPHWWPIVAGLVLVWMLRLMGLEPRVEAGDEGGRMRDEEAGSKAEGERRKAEERQSSGSS